MMWCKRNCSAKSLIKLFTCNFSGMNELTFFRSFSVFFLFSSKMTKRPLISLSRFFVSGPDLVTRARQTFWQFLAHLVLLLSTLAQSLNPLSELFNFKSSGEASLDQDHFFKLLSTFALRTELPLCIFEGYKFNPHDTYLKSYSRDISEHTNATRFQEVFTICYSNG